MFAVEAEVQVGKVDFTEDQADRRHDDVFYERVDDLAERSANYDTDGQIDDITPSDKFFEVFNHGFNKQIRRTGRNCHVWLRRFAFSIDDAARVQRTYLFRDRHGYP